MDPESGEDRSPAQAHPHDPASVCAASPSSLPSIPELSTGLLLNETMTPERESKTWLAGGRGRPEQEHEVARMGKELEAARKKIEEQDEELWRQEAELWKKRGEMEEAAKRAIEVEGGRDKTSARESELQTAVERLKREGKEMEWRIARMDEQLRQKEEEGLTLKRELQKAARAEAEAERGEEIRRTELEETLRTAIQVKLMQKEDVEETEERITISKQILRQIASEVASYSL
eukprot:3791936-Rhodomonas_salina.5